MAFCDIAQRHVIRSLEVCGNPTQKDRSLRERKIHLRQCPSRDLEHGKDRRGPKGPSALWLTKTLRTRTCRRYPMVVREFRQLRGEIWDASFSARLGKAASKLYREIYGESPNRRRSKVAHRNFVTRFPCGIIEQAYRQLIEQGVPLVGNVTPRTVWREQVRKLEEEKARANGPAANLDATATKDEAQDQCT
jgi:hypothetical protein